MLHSHILIVDDEPGIRLMLREILRDTGHQVTAVASGKDALAQLTQTEFDLALIDLHLGDMNGLSVLQALKAQYPDTVVIILTGYASLETAVEALRNGAHNYLFKPCKTVEIRESVSRALSKRQTLLYQRALLAEAKKNHAVDFPEKSKLNENPDNGRFLQKSDFVFDFMRHIVTFNGELLELSPTEFDILAYLTLQSPRVVSPQELVREIQGHDCDFQQASDIIRYHIYRLRRKLKKQAHNSNAHIRTARGVGYALGNID